MAMTRDTLGFAMKSTYGIVNGKEISIFKNPKTDDGTKKSAKGLLRVEKDKNNNYILHDNQTKEQEKLGELKIVFENGILYEDSFSQIRKRLEK